MSTKFDVFADSVREEFGDTDCACPDGNVASPRGLTASFAAPGWQVAPHLFVCNLSEQHCAYLNPTGQAGVVVLGPAARSLLEAYGTPRPLRPGPPIEDADQQRTTATVQQLAELGLLQPQVHAHQPRSRSQPQTLTAWLHVTNACNLRCTYCYVNKSAERMEEETGLRAVDAAFRSAHRNRFSRVKLKYAGGEATLNARLIASLHAHATQLGERDDVELQEVVLSNGVGLSRAFIQFLRDAGIQLMVSLDGMGDEHDKQRPMVNGRSSLPYVIRTLDRAAELGIKPFLSITVTAQNAANLAEVVSFALDRKLRFNLNFYRDHLAHNSAETLRAEQELLIAGMQNAFLVIESRMPRTRMIDLLVDRSSFRAPHEYACGVGSSYLVIDQRGGVAACQMEIERTVTDIGANDPLSELKHDEIHLTNPSVMDRRGCEECAWRFWCAGGCPLLTLRTTGRTDVKSPYCEVYKALYPEVIRLEGLRLLKWVEPLAMPVDSTAIV